MAAGRRRDDRSVLTPLAVLVLCALAERPMHPYEMLQVFESRKEDRFATLAPGTLYRTVTRLEERGLVRVDDVSRAGNRPERTVYAVTAVGGEIVREHLAALLATPSVEYSDLHLALAEAHELPRDQVVDLLATRIVHMRAELTRWETARDQASARGVPEMYLLDIGCRCATLRAQTDHLAALRGRLADGSLPWKSDPAHADCPLTDEDFPLPTPSPPDHTAQEYAR
ncbi:MAG: PadR family transcriptional regulator [Gordonia paraffinivorans]